MVGDRVIENEVDGEVQGNEVIDGSAPDYVANQARYASRRDSTERFEVQEGDGAAGEGKPYVVDGSGDDEEVDGRTPDQIFLENGRRQLFSQGAPDRVVKEFGDSAEGVFTALSTAFRSEQIDVTYDPSTNRVSYAVSLPQPDSNPGVTE